MAFIDLLELKRRQSILKMCLSDRSDGKTTQIKRFISEDFQQNGKAPIFLRRYMTEYTTDVINEFFTSDEYKKTPFYKSVAGYEFTPQPLKDMKGRTIGYTILYNVKGKTDEQKPAVLLSSLSTVARLKSALSRETYQNIYIDEYIPLDNRYTPNEPLTILETYKTIDRKHYDNQIMICGNKITRFNPIFQYWNIKHWKQGITQINPEFDLFVWSSKENREAEAAGRFGTLTSGTEYAGYNAGEFLISFEELIKKEHYKGKICYIIHGGRVYGVFWGVDCAVIEEVTTPPTDNTPRVCVAPCSPVFGRVLWLDNVPKIREILEFFKYQNKLFFADETTLDNLRMFYNKI